MKFDIIEVLEGTNSSGILFMIPETCLGLFSEVGDRVPCKISNKWNPLKDGKIEIECLYPIYPPLELYVSEFNNLVDINNIEVYSLVS